MGDPKDPKEEQTEKEKKAEKNKDGKTASLVKPPGKSSSKTTSTSSSKPVTAADKNQLILEKILEEKKGFSSRLDNQVTTLLENL